MDPLLPIDGKRYCKDHWSEVGRGKNDPKYNETTKDNMSMASEILTNPKILKSYSGKYLVIADQSVEMKNVKFNDLQKAINLVAEDGWKCLGISSNFAPVGSGIIHFYALMERINTSKKK